MPPYRGDEHGPGLTGQGVHPGHLRRAEVCVGAGLVPRVAPAGSPARFEIRTGDNHHHLVCRACGRTTDVDCFVGAGPCLTPSDEAGYEVDEARLLFWGLCPDCQQEDSRNKELFA